MAFNSLRRHLRWLAGGLGLANIAWAEAPTNADPGDVDVKPFAATRRYADSHHIALEGIELTAGPESIAPSDHLTVLFAIADANGTNRQWLVEIRAAIPTEREARTKPGTGLGILSFFQTSLKTDTGHEFSFEQSPVALEIETSGPFTEIGVRDQPLTVQARVVATRDYLTHGLAPMAEIEMRLRASGKKNPGISLMFRPKYSNEQMAATKARARNAGFTEADERTYAEAIYALVQFGNLGFKTPGLDAITHEIADSPTLFSGAFTNLNWPAMEVGDGRNWGLAGIPVYRVPFNFHSKTEARGFFQVTASRPPLQNLAGILALTIEGTSKVPGRRLVMRVLAGQRNNH